jgi:hypothetical protein
MLRIRNLKNVYQKRLIRPLYAQTQATPYAAILDDSLRDPVTKDWVLPAAAFKYKGGLVPGTVVTAVGEKVKVATGADPAAPTGATAAAPLAFGLLANFVAGELDDLGDENYVGVWRGPDSVYEILAPGFDDTGLSAAWDAVVAAGLGNVPLYAGVDGRLVYNGTPSNRQVVARLIERPNANRIVVDLKV